MRIYKNVRVIFPDCVRDRVVIANGGKITEICDRADFGDAEVIDGGGLYLSPGLVDIHVHGGGGYSAMSENSEDIIKMAEAHAKYGTTSIVPTTLASPVPVLHKAMDAIKEAMGRCTASNILGIHLEGPYLSQKKKGAQSEQDILTPVKVPPECLLDYSDKIIMMGAAPEIDGGLWLGKEIARRGIVASMAHSDGSYEDGERAFESGYSDVTHIFSASSSMHKQGNFRVAGIAEAGLTFDFTTQFIGDLRHLPVGIVRIIYRCKGADMAYAISDGLESSATQLQEGQIYLQKNGLSTVYENGVMQLADRSCLAGSATTSSKMLKNLTDIGISLTDAVKMTASTPARVAGFGKTKGIIAPGYDEDLILFDEEVNVKKVIVNGTVSLSAQ